MSVQPNPQSIVKAPTPRLLSWESGERGELPSQPGTAPSSPWNTDIFVGGGSTPVGSEPVGGGSVAKPSVVSMPSPNHDSREGAKIDTIVLHHTAGGESAEEIGRYFQKPSAEVSSHYVIGKDGTIVQPVQDADRAWHAGKSEFKGREDVNDFSLGIEIVNEGDDKDPYTDAQYRALGQLVAYLQNTYGVSWERITGHKDVAVPRGRKDDPSANFSYDRLRQEVAKAQGSQQRAPQPTPAPQPVAPPQPQPARQPSGATHTVAKGDTLWAIAQRTLGDGARWKEIFELNRDTVSNANLIYPGQTLRLPGAAPVTPAAPVAPAAASVNASLAEIQRQLQAMIDQLDALIRA